MITKRGFIYLISLVLSTIPLPYLFSNIALIVLIIYTIIYALKNKIKPKITFYELVFFAFYFLIIFSYFWSINKQLSVTGIERKVVFVLIPFLFLFIPRFDKEERNLIFKLYSLIMVAFACFFLVLGFLHFIKTGGLENLTHHNLVSPLNLNRIYVSLLMVIALFHWIISEPKSFTKTLIIVFLSIFILLLSSKTIVITSILIVVGHILIKNKTSFTYYKFFTLLITITVLILISNKVNNKFISELIPDYKSIITKTDFGPNYYFNGAELRILYTRFLIEYEKEENILFTGFGVNAAQKKINDKCVQYNLYEGYGKTYNFYNQYNQTLAEIGLIGLLILLYILYLGFKKAIINKDNFAVFVLIIFSILLLTESLFNRQRGLFIFLTTYFLIINYKQGFKHRL